jgi:signal transduction histidine kinase
VDERRLDLLGGAIGLTATFVVVLPVVLELLVGGVIDGGAPGPLWWACYLVFVAAFVVDATCGPWWPAWLDHRQLLVVEVLAATATYLVEPTYGWSAVLLVVAAVSASFVLDGGTLVTLVAVLTTVAGLGVALAGLPLADVVVSALVYGTFLSFATLVAYGQRREAEARTELVTAHAQLRASSALLAESSATAERLRIARDLHDLVGHQLTALSLELEVAAHQADPPARDHVTRARDAAKGLLGDVRQAVGELRVPTHGLEPPLQALVDGLPGLEVHLQVVEEVPVDEERALAVVRCVQEVVTNTVRHATADNLWLSVTATTAGVGVEARDDGRGSEQVDPGNGLTGMRERLEQLGGELRIATARGQGFAVTAWVPTS